MCPECLILRRQIVALKGKIDQLRMTLRDMGYDEPPRDSMYEDELPLVPWGDDR